MNTDIPTGPPPAYTRGDATFAQVAKDLHSATDLGPDFKDALDAFRQFLASQEIDRLSKHQLKLLRSQAVYVLEECAKHKHAGGDLSTVLPVVTEIFTGVSEELRQGPRWDEAITDPSVIRRLESTIGNAVDRLEDQMHQMANGEDAESTTYKNELERARENDRRKIGELESVIRELQSSDNQSPSEVVESSIEENLKFVGNPSASFGKNQIDARRSLAIIAELTGKSLPPNTMLDRKFVTIGNQAINQGSSYDVFVGEYFTGERIAIKVLRHRVDEETAKKTHERFARLAENWSALRHDCILPFYGVGVMQSPVSPTEYQLYLVSPYLKNQDVKRYIKMYPKVPRQARLQMALDVARGLKYMHGLDDLPEVGGKGLVHGALNVYNVLVKDSGRAVISGFGHAKALSDCQASFTGDNSEYRYMGPEILDDAVLTFGSDLWSWAMVSLEILTDEPPFGRKSRGTQIIQAIGTNQRPIRANHLQIEEYERNDEIWKLFEDCWIKAPEDRPTANGVVQRLKSLTTQFEGKNTNLGQRPKPSLECIAPTTGWYGHNGTAEHRRNSQPRSEQGEPQRILNPTLPQPVFLENPPEGRMDTPVYPFPRRMDHLVTISPPVQIMPPLADIMQTPVIPTVQSHPPLAYLNYTTPIEENNHETPWPVPSIPPNQDEPEVKQESANISSAEPHVSAKEINMLLSRHGCPDVTMQLDPERCSSYPVAQGGFADVYCGNLRNGLKVAIKRSRVRIPDDEEGRSCLRIMAKEGYIWSKHQHDNILEICGVAQFRGGIALVTPWMDNGTVMEFIRDQPNVDRPRLCTQVAWGLVYLHEMETIHGDLKGANILVSEDGIARLADFGSTSMKQHTLQFTGGTRSSCFTLRWAAPELLTEGGMSAPADVYALGMVR
ncbi:hypothetical protein FRC11_006859 [Ceratobasidium sp. 423]|nr:hypothetical protein FRC11_006859 [Ceratobasidium sp. 423]